MKSVRVRSGSLQGDATASTNYIAVQPLVPQGFRAGSTPGSGRVPQAAGAPHSPKKQDLQELHIFVHYD